MSTSTPALAKLVVFPRVHHASAIADRLIRTERRLKARYPLDLSVRFRSSSASRVSGTGHAVNMSSSGILVFVGQAISQQEIRVGALVEIRIEWPSLLDGRVPLQLFAVVRVVRCRSDSFAAMFERHQFRTVSSSK
jgi:PilZ domain